MGLGLRRLLSMSPDLHWNNSVKIMDEFVVKMYRSGYPSSWRTEAVKSALNMHEDMIQEELSGKRPLFRPKDFMLEERRIAKLQKQSTWHKGHYEEGILAGAPLIICPSAGEVVSRKMKQVCKLFSRSIRLMVKFLNGVASRLARLLSQTLSAQKGVRGKIVFLAPVEVEVTAAGAVQLIELNVKNV